ncbi:MAG TPA: hypothetical protein VF665_16540 [Longimicrobium sp.]|jgi:hypothetical protein
MEFPGLFSWGLLLKTAAALMVLLLVVTLRVLRGRASLRQPLDEDDELR